MCYYSVDMHNINTACTARCADILQPASPSTLSQVILLFFNFTCCRCSIIQRGVIQRLLLLHLPQLSVFTVLFWLKALVCPEHVQVETLGFSAANSPFFHVFLSGDDQNLYVLFSLFH